MRLRVVNSQSRAITFCLEPWGELYDMPPDAIFEVVGRGPEGDSLELEVSSDAITVYGWAGSIVEVFRDGAVLEEGPLPRTPVPSTVPETSTRQTMRTLGVR